MAEPVARQSQTSHSTVLTQFAAQVSESPERPAVEWRGQTTSYRALDRRSNQIARCLVRHGVQPEHRVGLAVQRGPDLVAAMLGVMKAGAAYVPLDPDLPAERLAYMITDSGLRVVVSDDDLIERVPARIEHRVTPVQWRGEIATALDIPVDPDQLAYVLYTSGSTGRPKAVHIPHAALANFLSSMQREPGLSARDTLLALTTVSFDISGLELLLPLTVGARIVIASRDDARDGDRLRALVDRKDVTVVQATPSSWAMLLAAGWSGNRRLKALCGGEALSPELAASLGHRVGQLWNMYGPTETTIWSSCCRLVPGRPIGLGKPIASTRLYVLDPDSLELQPTGVVGELFIAGAGLARGYGGQPALTAERFVPDPHAPGAGERMYRTGDRVKRGPDGTLAFVGRIDDQIKLRGHRIELGEIESVLAAHPAVTACAVALRPDRRNEPQLVAYAVADTRDPRLLQDFLRARLPEIMVPAAVVFLDRLPVSPSGKLDRKALPAPDLAVQLDPEAHVPPATDDQRALAQLWCQLLALDRVGIRDDFFALGGHSLLATQVASRVRERFGVQLSLREFFERPTIETMAAAIADARDRGDHSAAPLLAPGPADAPLVPSYAQHRLWFLHQLDPDSAAYHMAFARRLRGPLDIPVLRAALEAVIHRHDSLRMRFPATDGVPRLAIDPPAPWPLPVDDLTGHPHADREPAAAHLAADLARQPFDLAAGPLVRTRLLRLGHDDHVLVVVLHHIIGDGWSIDLLWRDLAAIYDRGGASLPPPAVGYADYARWQRQWLTGDVLDNHLDYWKQQLRGAPADTDLPSRGPRPPAASDRADIVAARLDIELTRNLLALSRRHGATLFMTLVAGLRALLARYTGQTDLCIGTPVANRDRRELEEVIGLFVNTLVLRGQVARDDSFEALLRRERDIALSAYTHQDAPFEMLVDALDLPRDHSRTPLFQVWFVHEETGTSATPAGASGLFVERFDIPLAAAKYDLAIYARERPDGLALHFLYSEDRFDRAAIEQMVGHYAELLAAVAGNDAATVCDLPLSPPAMQRPVLPPPLAARPAVDGDPGDDDLFSRFARRVERDPDRVAIEDPERVWTYGELAERARVVAAGLARANVRGQRVALALGHDGEMVAATLGVLASGNAYVPLDPSSPAERLAYIVDDCAAAAIVSDQRRRDLAHALTARVRQLALEDLGDGQRDPLPACDPGSLAYILYTSGSTGRPKGVLQSHRNTLHHATRYAANLRIADDDRLSLLSSYGFDAAVMDIYGALLSGAVLCPYSVRERGIDGLAGWLSRAGVTVYHSTPTVYRQLVAGRPDRAELARIRAVVLGGEETTRDDLAAFRALFADDGVFVNGFGPTESTLALQRVFDKRSACPRPSASMGYPVDGDTEVVLETPLGRQAAIHGVGEITIASRRVALGYWNRPDETAAAFARAAGERRRYRTGDLGRLLPDGSIEHAGRRDDQVKIRGFRVELREIEGTLALHPDVAVAAATLDTSAGAARLVGHLVAVDGASIRPPEILRFVADRLPDFMVPVAIVQLDAMPIGPTGKIDRRALAAPDWSALTDPATSTPPRSPEEAALVDIWTELLGRQGVGVRDDFFALGGHSLLATQVASRVMAVLGVELPLRTVFDAPTVEALARAIIDRRGDSNGESAPLAPAPAGTDRPLSHAQQRLWFLHQLAPESAAYHIGFARRLRGALSVEALRQALDLVTARHAILRTVFPAEHGIPRQEVSLPAPWKLAVDDLSGLAADDRADRLETIASDEAYRPFDLEAGPLLRARLVRLAEHDHVLVVTMHHIVSDGWSMGVFWRDLAAGYDEALRGASAPALLELPVQYADYAIWQRDRLAGDHLDRELAYWTQQLRGAPAETTLPLKGPRPAVQGHRAGRVSMTIDRDRARRLRELARRHGATLFMTLAAGLRALIFRYTGQQDVCIGTPIANRNRREIEELIGFFVNTLVLRGQVTGDDSFASLLGKERDAALDAYAHASAPFEMVVDAVGVERSLSRNPLYQIAFAHQTMPGRVAALTGIDDEPYGLDLATAQVDLSVYSLERDGAIDLAFVYDDGLFDRAFVEQLGRHYLRLLESAAAEPARAISRLAMVSSDERASLASRWNHAALAVPPLTLPELFEAQVERTPDAIAVELADSRASFRELDRRANQIAWTLRELGVGPDSVVAISVERSIDVVASTLAVMKAGGAYVPLDPTLPAQRLALATAASRPLAAIATAATAHVPASLGLPVVDLGDPAISVRSTARPDPIADGDNLAYVIFTSGSTGRPKGVMVSHRAIVNKLHAVQSSILQLDASDAYLQLAPLSFDAWVHETFWPLCFGARVVLVREGDHRDPARIVEQIRAHQVTALVPVPSLLRALVAEPDLERCTSLRHVLTAGEALPLPLMRDFMSRLPAVGLINAYGPTEAAVMVAGWHCRPEATAVVIGAGWPNTALHVVDGDLELVPLGVAGELVVGGPQVARGYADQPPLTAERFVPDPFSETPGARLYRTGDRVRRRADGAIEFLGRIDHQVKIRGFRIELGEVEVAISAHSAVRQCAVVASEATAGDRRLVAYVSADPVELAVPALREHLVTRLPDYMIPSAFVFLDAWPLTASGKLDRGALPSPDWSAAARAESAPPAGPEQDALAAIWSEVLGVERIGAREDFFALGGHSLLATQVVARACAVFGVDLTLRNLFEMPTVEGMAAHVQRLRATSARPAAPPLAAAARDRELPLSHAQQRMWFLHQLEPDSTTYNMTVVRRLSGPLDRDAMQRAFEAVIARHESLRTVFPAHAGTPRQEVRPAGPWDLAVTDLSSLPSQDAGHEADRRVADEADRPFDLAAGPLVRTSLVRAGVDEHLLILTMHHIVADGWSIDLLWRELAARYVEQTGGESRPAGPLRFQYADYAVWQRAWLADGALTRQLAYWKDQLHDAPVHTALPLAGPRPHIRRHRGATVSATLDSELTRGLRELSRRERSTLFMTLGAALRALLYRYTEQDDLCLGMPIANRSHRDIEGMIGLFVNTLVLRGSVHRGDTLAELVRREREIALAAYAHQETPFEVIVDALGVDRTLSQNPLFQVWFAHDAARRDPPPLDRLQDLPYRQPRHTSKFDLAVHTREHAGTIAVTMTYDEDLFERQVIEHMAEHFVRLLQTAVRDPDAAVGRLALVGSDEQRQLIARSRGTTSVVGGLDLVSVLDMFEARVEQSQHLTAVVMGASRLSYLALDERANQIAWALRDAGVGPESAVGIALERGPDLIASILGTMKADAAYVPLDPALPRARLASMIADSGCQLAICDATTAPQLAGLPLRTIAVGGLAETSRTAAPPRRSGPDNLAYVLFTSGSTGRPKGVMVSHRSIANEIISAQAIRAQLDDTDAYLQLAAHTFDLSVHEVLWPLCHGAQLVLMPGDDRRDPERIVEEIRRQRITTIHLTPLMLRAVIDGPGLADCPSLRRVAVGGEALPVRLMRDAAAQLGAVPLFNSYGPTETAVTVSQWRCDAEASSVAIGTPWLNTSLYILDPELEPVPEGVVGELYIAGPQVALGYIGQPGLTADHFPPDPWSIRPGARMYRTGDRARRSVDGNVEFLGRGDHQVKIRGFRIELGEIEASLRAHPGIQDAVVVARRAGEVEAALVAYVVPVRGEVPLRTLRELVRERLPEYMVPSAFAFIDRLPRTPSGKLDRLALPPPDDALFVRADYAAPHSEVEQIVAAIWSELLGVPDIGVHDDFFLLGGNSLLATRARWELESALGVDLPLREIFACATIAQLAEVIAARRARSGRPANAPIEPSGGDTAPATVPQVIAWQLDPQDASNPLLRVTLARLLEGPLDRVAFARSIELLWHRHSVFRTRYREDRPGVLMQEVIPAAQISVPVPFVDLSKLPVPDRDREQARFFEELRSAPFDLDRGSALRGGIVALAPDRHVAALVIHHIAMDGGGLSALVTDLQRIYMTLVAGPGSGATLPASPELQYVDYANHIAHHAESRAGMTEAAYWHDRLSGAPGLELPTDFSRASVDARRDDAPAGLVTFPAQSCQLEITGKDHERLVRLGRQEQVTRYMVLLAALAATLHELTGQDDLCFQSTYSQRHRRQLSSMLGVLGNPLIMRIDVSGRPTFRELLRRTRRAVLSAFDHGSAPLLLSFPHAVRRFNFNYVPVGAGATSAPFANDLVASAIQLGSRTASIPWDLHLSLHAGPQATRLILLSNESLFRPETAQDLLGRYVERLSEIAQPPTIGRKSE